MEEELVKCQKQLESLQAEVEWYKRLYPEVSIFYDKVNCAEYLLKISLKDLKKAPEQSWYGEYLALLAIRLENTPLRYMCKQSAVDLMKWYNKFIGEDKRELAILGIIQLIEPSELIVPLNQHLWHKKMIADVQAIFWNNYVESTYTNENIATYYISRQSMWQHEKRKIRVAFITNSYVSGDKLFPVYEEMKKRDNIEPFIVLYPATDYKYLEIPWWYFKQRYPNDVIYNCTLTDLQKLRPDYVFIPSPYNNMRPFCGIRTNDVVKFSKVCIISYGATLAYVFAKRLFEDFFDFWQNVYFHFASAETVKSLMIEKFPKNVAMNYQHVEFLGYPQLKAYYEADMEPYMARRILWTPRWLIDDTWGGSHFMAYKDKFVELRKKYGDKVDLVFRPHPDLLKELKRKKLMSDGKINAYMETLKKNNILQPTSYMDMDKTIRNIDIFLTDYSSVMVCFFLTGRPIIYCELPNAVPLPEYEEMFAAMYIAKNWKDVENYLDDLIAGNDPLFEKRQEIAKKIYETHKDATEKIVDRIVKDFNQSLAR